MPVSMVLPDDVEQSMLTALSAGLANINVGAISDKDIDDDDQLVLDMPCARQRYVGCDYRSLGDNQALTYEAPHLFEIWCAAEDLTSKEAQRTATLQIVRLVLPLIVGARLPLADGSITEPVVLRSIGKLPDDIVGTIFIVTVEVSAIAQFPGTLSSGNEDD